MMPLDMVVLSAIAFIVGTVAAMTGVGGGVFIVPLLSLAYGFPPHLAVGTSLATIVFTSLSSAVGYSSQKRIDYRVGLVLALTTIPGGLVGASLTTIIEEKLLGLIFGVFVVFVALRMTFRSVKHPLRVSRTGKFWHRKIVDSDGAVFEYQINVKLGLLLSFFGGLSSGLLGIGGGSLMVPILHLTLNLPMHVAVATSMFIMVFTSTSGATMHLILGNVHTSHIVFLCVGVITGAQIGAYFSKKTSGKGLRRMFGAVLLLVGLRMILKYLF